MCIWGRCVSTYLHYLSAFRCPTPISPSFLYLPLSVPPPLHALPSFSFLRFSSQPFLSFRLSYDSYLFVKLGISFHVLTILWLSQSFVMCCELEGHPGFQRIPSTHAPAQQVSVLALLGVACLSRISKTRALRLRKVCIYDPCPFAYLLTS